MIILETERLVLRKFTSDDTGFVLEIVNDPDWLKYIGDKDVHNHDDALNYITQGPVASYEKNGFGLYVAILKNTKIPVGICGLVKRDGLDHPDVGFAFLAAHRGKGYATESAAAVLEYGYKELGLDKILAVTSPDNDASGRVLEKIGLRFEKMIHLSEDDPGSKLFVPGGE